MSDSLSEAAAAGKEGLATQLRELESFAARAAAEGEVLPPEAALMLERLREVVSALDGLTRSMGE